MKKALKVTAITILCLALLFIAGLVLINLPSTKKKVGNYFITYLKEQYGLRLEASEFSYEFEKNLLIIRMNNVRIYGGKTSNELFFQTKSLEAEIPYTSFRGDHFLVTSIVLNMPDVNPENLPHLQRKQPESKNARTFEIRQIDLKGGALRYERFPLNNIDLVARVKDNNLLVSKLNAKFDTIAIEGSGELKNLSDPHYLFHYIAKGNASSIEKVVSNIPPLKGEFIAEGQVTGTTGAYAVEGKAQSSRLSAFHESAFPVRGTYRFDSASVTDPLSYKVQWESAPASLARRMEPEVPEIASITEGTFEFKGGKNFWQGTGSFEVRLDSIQTRGIPLTGKIAGELENGTIQLSRSNLTTGTTETTFEGQLSQSQMKLDVNANVKNPASLAFLTPELRKVPGSYFIRSRIQGPYKNLQIEWNLKGTAPEVQLVSTGSYRMAAKQLQANFRGQADAKALERLYPANLQGNLTFEGKASGNIASPVVAATVRGTELSIHGTEIGEAVVDLNSDGRVLNADAQIPSYSTAARGSYHFANRNFELQGHSDQLDLAMVRPFLPANAQEAEGTFTATFDASGNVRRWKDSEAHVTLEQANLKYREFNAVIENATADLSDHTATLDVDALTSHGTVQAQGTIPVFRPGEMNLEIAGQTDMKFLSLFQPTMLADGPVTIDAHLGGTFDKPDYSGRASAENFSVRYPDPPFELTKGNMVAEFRGEEVVLRGTGNLNGSSLTVDGRVPLANRAGFVHLTLDNFSVDTLATEADVHGYVSIDMDAHGIGRNLESWSGFFKIVPSQLVVSGHAIEAPEPLELEMTSARMILNTVRFKSGEILDAQAQGQINFRTGAVEGVVHNEMDLSLLSGFMTNTAAEGKLIADVRIAGTMKNPDMQGEIQVENGMFRKFESPILLEQIQLRAPVHKNGIRIETLTARMGGGTVEGSGEIKLENWKPKTVDLRVAARGVGMDYPESLRSQLNADLTMVNQGTDFLVSGKVQVIRSTYKEDIDPRDRLVNSLLSEKTALSTRTSAQGRIRLDVAVETLEDFQMRNNMGKIQAGANLQVRGLLEEPRLFGRIRVRERSEIYFEGNRFEVRRGLVDFYGQRRFNPTFDVELFTIATDAETRQDYEITIPLSGELHNLDRRDPFSFPPLASNQIYFLLLTGRADEQLGTAGSRFFTQQLASFAAGQVFSGLTRELAKGVGLDRVEIEPEMISSEEDPGAKLVLGKDFTSDLSLLYSISFTDAQDQTWIANYKAPKNLSFRFVDQEESYTANIRHLIRFGEGISTGTLSPPRSRKTSIQKIEIENDSLLSNEEILSELGLEEGDEYDFWAVQDELEKLEETLQERGILFSLTQSDEMALGSNQVGLKIKIFGKERREMTVQGYEVSSGQMDQYRRFWREGFSPEGVSEIIRENLLKDLWKKGYHKAEVRKEVSNQNGIILHRFVVQPGELYKETQIKFLQAELYPAEELEEDLHELYPDREEMISDAIHNFRSIERKIVALYVRRGFLDASVESGKLQLSPELAIKEIKVLEGEVSKIVHISVSKNQQLPEDLFKRLKLKIGMVHDAGALLEDEVTIGDFYERLGYKKVQVESSVEKTDAGLILRYDLKTGEVATIDSIEIEGARLTNPGLIRKRVQMKEGEILNQDKIANAQKNLTDLRIFHQVTIRDIPTEEDPNRYRVVIEVIERNHYELTYGLRYDTETDLGGEVQITDLNLFGTGQSVSLYTRIHQQDQLYRLVYHSPTLSGLRWKTLISTSYERGNLLVLLDNDQFEGEKYDLTLQRQFNLGNDFLLIPGFQFEYLTLTPLEDSNIEAVDGLKVSRLIGTLLRDSRDDPFNTKRGTFFSIDAQVAPGWLGDVSYVKSYNQYLRFIPYKNFLWASAVRIGLASDLPPRVVTERFFAGGSFTLRGFKRDEVGPKFEDGTPVGGKLCSS